MDIWGDLSKISSLHLFDFFGGVFFLMSFEASLTDRSSERQKSVLLQLHFSYFLVASEVTSSLVVLGLHKWIWHYIWLSLITFLLGIVLMLFFEGLPDTLEYVFICSTECCFLSPLKEIGGRRESMMDKSRHKSKTQSQPW